MRIAFGLALITWGTVVLFLLPDAVPQKLANYTIIGLYCIAIGWWLFQLHPAWTAYWLAAAAITCVVTFGDLSVK